MTIFMKLIKFVIRNKEDPEIDYKHEQRMKVSTMHEGLLLENHTASRDGLGSLKACTLNWIMYHYEA
jgi:hypothetical protein